MTYRPPATLECILLRLAAGGWVQVCRANAELLLRAGGVEVQHKPFMRTWQPLESGYEYAPRMLFRVRSPR